MALERVHFIFFLCPLLPSPPSSHPFFYTLLSCSDKMVKGLPHTASIQIGLMGTRTLSLGAEGYKAG